METNGDSVRFELKIRRGNALNNGEFREVLRRKNRDERRGMTRNATFLSGTILILGIVGTTSGAESGRVQPSAAAEQVDRILASELPGSGPRALLANDEIFIRRVTLDLLGQSPSPEDVVLFSIDDSAQKRQELIERLLNDPRFGENWGRYWRDVIFYRKTEERALFAAEVCAKYLAEELNRNASWDQIATAFITATGDVREHGNAGLIMAQGGKPEEVVAEVSRIFLGIQIQCAQCHDHPTDRWKREQFHELAAFFPRVAVRRDMSTQPPTFTVVVNDREQSMPRRPNANQRQIGTPEHRMPDKDDPSARGTVMNPVFFLTGQSVKTGTKDSERRGALAEWITNPGNPWFAKAYVNRIWAELVGEGFYEPIDDLGPDRECATPATLDYLAARFVESGYDTRWLFHTIMSTEAYQHASLARHPPDTAPFQASVPQRLRADQIYSQISNLFGIPESGAPAGAAARPGLMNRSPRFQFNSIFGYDPSAPRDEVAGSIPQALLLMNHNVVRQGVDARRGVLARLLGSVKNDDELIVELYLRTLSRQPSDGELDVCRKFIREVGNRSEAFEDILWSLVNSTEFLHRR